MHQRNIHVVFLLFWFDVSKGSVDVINHPAFANPTSTVSSVFISWMIHMFTVIRKFLSLTVLQFRASYAGYCKQKLLQPQLALELIANTNQAHSATFGFQLGSKNCQKRILLGTEIRMNISAFYFAISFHRLWDVAQLENNLLCIYFDVPNHFNFIQQWSLPSANYGSTHTEKIDGPLLEIRQPLFTFEAILFTHSIGARNKIVRKNNNFNFFIIVK